MKKRRFSSGEKRNIYKETTDKIIQTMEKNPDGEWEMPWHGTNEIPKNVDTGNFYRGVNIVNLWASSMIQEFRSTYWGTFQQWKNKGAMVKKGEKASSVIFYKVLENEHENEEGEVEEVRIPIMKYSSVFNAQQVEGWEETIPEQKEPVQIIEEVRSFVANTLADIRIGGGRAFYRPSGDYIQMPDTERFKGTETSTVTEAYYGTLLHELTHWTGAPSRCDREIANKFGDDKYAIEELVAELGAAFLCAKLGIASEPREDHAQYIAHWKKHLEDDPKLIFRTAAMAQRGVEYLEGLQPGETEAPSRRVRRKSE